MQNDSDETLLQLSTSMITTTGTTTGTTTCVNAEKVTQELSDGIHENHHSPAQTMHAETQNASETTKTGGDTPLLASRGLLARTTPPNQAQPASTENRAAMPQTGMSDVSSLHPSETAEASETARQIIALINEVRLLDVHEQRRMFYILKPTILGEVRKNKLVPTFQLTSDETSDLRLAEQLVAGHSGGELSWDHPQFDSVLAALQTSLEQHQTSFQEHRKDCQLLHSSPASVPSEADQLKAVYLISKPMLQPLKPLLQPFKPLLQPFKPMLWPVQSMLTSGKSWLCHYQKRLQVLLEGSRTLYGDLDGAADRNSKLKAVYGLLHHERVHCMKLEKLTRALMVIKEARLAEPHQL